MYKTHRARDTQMGSVDAPAIVAPLQVLRERGVVIVGIPRLGLESVAAGPFCHGRISFITRLRLSAAIALLTRNFTVDTGIPTSFAMST